MAHKMLDIAQHLYFKMIQYQFWTLPVWHWREGRSTAQDSTFFESWNSMDLSDSRSKQLDIENMKRENNGKYMNITVNHWGMTLLISPMIYPRTSHEKTG